MAELSWWQSAVIYEIYPRSFQDSGGDGIGDLTGISQRLDHLVKLGVNALWVTPFYPSPMADFGYDVADYCGVDPIFGSIADFDLLLNQAHGRGLKIILDFVPNHTSDKHPWFIESRSSRNSPKRDWYLWRDTPNNWLSNFGGSAWQVDEVTSQYYYHSFLKQQPDLNWRNPAVRQAMYDVLRFWLRRGVDGFRVDVMWMMIKDDQFRDNPPNPEFHPGAPSNHAQLPLYTTDRPEVHDLVAEMRSVIDTYSDRVLIGEIYLPVPQLMTYYGNNLNEANLPFNFQLLRCPWDAAALGEAISAYMAALPAGAWPNWVLGNHDNPRLASRVGAKQGRVAAMLLLTLPGTLTIYYGEEIGMTDVAIAPDEVQDPAERNEPGVGAGRDPERTPMQWDGTASAGFTTGQPWLPIAPDAAANHVAAQGEDAASLLQFYRALIQLRRKHPALVSGRLTGIEAQHTILSYERADENERLQVVLNLGDGDVETQAKTGTILHSASRGREGERTGMRILLGANEGLLIQLDT